MFAAILCSEQRRIYLRVDLPRSRIANAADVSGDVHRRCGITCVVDPVGGLSDLQS
jgi:hypothetical protein